METLTRRGDPEAFLERLGACGRGVLLLDFDGTLAPFAARRQDAMPYPGVVDALARIAAGARTRLAVVSGRALRDLEARLPGGLPIELWGSHGLEHRGVEGRSSSVPVSAPLTAMLGEASAWAANEGWSELFERKPFGFALHRRAGPDAYESACRAAAERWAGPARQASLSLVEFDGGIEFRPRGAGKGDVVRRILREEGEACPIACLGDDQTDEDAFAALGDRGLPVLVRSERRVTEAALWIRPPEELVWFLHRWAATLEGRG